MAMACLVAGIVGAACGIAMVAWPTDVPDDRYSYPLSAGGFIALQIFFGVHHLGLLAGQLELRRAGVAGDGRAARIGHLTGIAGMVLLIVTEFLATAAADSTYPGKYTGRLDVLYGISTLAVGGGLIAVGIATLRAGAWQSWRKWVPLAIGIYVFVPMTPAIALGYIGARLSISGWMLMYALLGLALLRTETDETAR